VTVIPLVFLSLVFIIHYDDASTHLIIVEFFVICYRYFITLYTVVLIRTLFFIQKRKIFKLIINFNRFIKNKVEFKYFFGFIVIETLFSLIFSIWFFFNYQSVQHTLFLVRIKGTRLFYYNYELIIYGFYSMAGITLH